VLRQVVCVAKVNEGTLPLKVLHDAHRPILRLNPEQVEVLRGVPGAQILTFRFLFWFWLVQNDVLSLTTSQKNGKKPSFF